MLTDASKIIMDERILDATSRARFNYLYAKLTQLSTNLAQFHGMGSSRTRPFAVHIAGAPGCGKSLFVPTLLKDCFGLVESDLWTRELHSPFWNGYINQKCVFIDEFLCGSTAKRDEVGLEYLQLVSDSSYCPNMASVDNPMVGVKGTPAKPEIVITANNTPYDVVSSIDNLALHSRRSVVILMRIKKNGVNMIGPGNVDLRSFSADQLRNPMVGLLSSVCSMSGQGDEEPRRDSSVVSQKESWLSEWLTYAKDYFSRLKSDCPSTMSNWMSYVTAEQSVLDMMTGNVKLYSFSAALMGGMATAWAAVKVWRHVLHLVSPTTVSLGQESDRPDRESSHELIMSRPDVVKGLSRMYGEGRGQLQELLIRKGSRKVRAIGLRSHWVMTYGHGLNDMELKDGDMLTVEYGNTEHAVVFDEEAVRSVPSQDVVFVWLGSRTLPQFKDITNRFLNIVEWSGLDDALCIMNSLSVSGRRVKTGKEHHV